MNNIAIIGATGMLGKPVAKAFIAAGFTVTLLARDAAKASAVFGPSVRVVREWRCHGIQVLCEVGS